MSNSGRVASQVRSAALGRDSATIQPSDLATLPASLAAFPNNSHLSADMSVVPQQLHQPPQQQHAVCSPICDVLSGVSGVYAAPQLPTQPAINVASLPISLPLNVSFSPQTGVLASTRSSDLQKSSVASDNISVSQNKEPNWRTGVQVPGDALIQTRNAVAPVQAPYYGPHVTIGTALLAPAASAQAVHALGTTQSFADVPTLSSALTTAPTHVPEVQMASAYRIGRYTPAERRIRIARYLEKRSQRNYKKRVKYDCRKTIADKRYRVQGRFVKREEEEALALGKNPRALKDACSSGKSSLKTSNISGVTLSVQMSPKNEAEASRLQGSNEEDQSVLNSTTAGTSRVSATAVVDASTADDEFDVSSL